MMIPDNSKHMEKMAGWQVIPQSPPDGRSRHADLVTAEIPLPYKNIFLLS
jgi:hypothetical protein